MTTYVCDDEKIREPTDEELAYLREIVRYRNAAIFKELMSLPDIVWGDTLRRYFWNDKEARNWINAHLPT